MNLMPELSVAELATRHEGMGSTDVVEVCGLAPWEVLSASLYDTAMTPPRFKLCLTGS